MAVSLACMQDVEALPLCGICLVVNAVGHIVQKEWRLDISVVLFGLIGHLEPAL
jgi:hypothetical protein